MQWMVFMRFVLSVFGCNGFGARRPPMKRRLTDRRRFWSAETNVAIVGCNFQSVKVMFGVAPFLES